MIYIGYHRTRDINDNYMGSGILISRAVKKHGISNFSKEVLFVFDTEQEALNKEHEIVNEEFVYRNDTYNKTVGGGKPPVVSEWWTKEHSKNASERMKGNDHKKGKKESEQTRHKKIKSFKDSTTHGLHLKNKSEETKKRMSNSKKGKKLPQTECPYCGKPGDVMNMKRWHFDNCKKKG